MFSSNFKKTAEYKHGFEVMKSSSVSICSIVRDCGRNLEQNLPRVEKLRSLFNKSEVVIFENDSKDNTKKILINWQNRSDDIYIYMETYSEETIPSKELNQGNKYFSISRIEKMAKYRNKYMDFLNSHNINRDFVIVIDLDIANFSIDGIVHSFGIHEQWDCITANGRSISSKFKMQYHDSYALIEFGKINEVQTENSIFSNRSRFDFLKPGLPLIPVDSAYGGLAIYKWNSIAGIAYEYVENNDDQVRSKSEHVALHKMMKENGFMRIYINPSMLVKYRSLSVNFLISKLVEKLS